MISVLLQDLYLTSVLCTMYMLYRIIYSIVIIINNIYIHNLPIKVPPSVSNNNNNKKFSKREKERASDLPIGRY